MDTSTPWKLTLLSFTCLFGLSGVLAQFNIPNTQVDVVKGQMAVLEVRLTQPGSDITKNTIHWIEVANKTRVVLTYAGNIINVGDEQFRDRVGFRSTMPSNDLSLYINDTRESDSGRYNCQIIAPSGSATADDITLSVKVPPSVPECSLSGKPVLKGNVTLSCRSKTGEPVPLYKWTKTGPPDEMFFPPMANSKLGTLKLSNLTKSKSGKYLCTASNSVGSQTCVINLEIITSTNAGVIAGATVGSVVGFVLLLLFIIFLLKKSRDNEDDMANDIKEDAQAPKRVSWAKSGMGSDIISKNGTMSSITSSPHQKDGHHLHHYPQRPPSDTASIVTATGSTAGYRPSRQHGASTPTQYGYNHSSTLPRGPPASSERSANGGSPLPRTERSTPLPEAHPPPPPPLTYSQPQFASHGVPPAAPGSVVTAANISRMGGVPIMVPAQNQAGSLV